MSTRTAAPRRSSAAVEVYLERILELINTKGYARVVDIAQGLKISQASVTNMVQRLDAEERSRVTADVRVVNVETGEYLCRVGRPCLARRSSSRSSRIRRVLSITLGLSAAVAVATTPRIAPSSER